MLNHLMREVLNNERELRFKTDSTTDIDNDGDGANATYMIQDLKIAVGHVLLQWLEEDDSDSLYGDLLFNLCVGIVDENHNGELDDNEQELFNVVLNLAYTFITEQGITEEDAQSLLIDFDNEVAERVRDFLKDKLPPGDETDNLIEQFAFEKENMEYDAVYKKMFAVRAGKKTWIRKKVSGVVRISAKVRQALTKARLKSHSASAQMHRMKSLRLRKRLFRY